MNLDQSWSFSLFLSSPPLLLFISDAEGTKMSVDLQSVSSNLEVKHNMYCFCNIFILGYSENIKIAQNCMELFQNNPKQVALQSLVALDNWCDGTVLPNTK